MPCAVAVVVAAAGKGKLVAVVAEKVVLVLQQWQHSPSEFRVSDVDWLFASVAVLLLQ